MGSHLFIANRQRKVAAAVRPADKEMKRGATGEEKQARENDEVRTTKYEFHLTTESTEREHRGHRDSSWPLWLDSVPLWYPG